MRKVRKIVICYFSIFSFKIEITQPIKSIILKTNNIFLTEHQSIITMSKLADQSQLPICDNSSFLFLEILEEKEAKIVHKVYDKSQYEFIEVKKYKKVLEEGNKGFLEDIMLEDALLQEVEKIRTNQPDHNEYFLKYDGVFKDSSDQTALILKEESGCANLDNILEAGKVFSCPELFYAHRKMVEGFAILEENGIATRNVKAQNIILVEDPKTDQQRFFYKIHEFGNSCLLPKNSFLVASSSLKGIMNEFTAPEVVRLLVENSPQKIEYNPFLADVYSLGLVALKMINKSWGKNEVEKGLLSMKDKFEEYQPILELLNGMLEEDL